MDWKRIDKDRFIRMKCPLFCFCFSACTYIYLGKTGNKFDSMVALSARVVELHQLLLCRGVRLLPTNKCSGYNTKQFDGQVQVILELWGTQSTPSLPLLPGPIWFGMVAPDRALSYGLNRTNCMLLC